MRSFIVAALTALTALTPAAGQVAGDTASVQAFYQRWFGSAAQGPDAYASFYAPDGEILPPNAAPVKGREEIAGWMARAQSERPYTIQPEGLTIDAIRFLTPDWVSYRTILRGQRVPKAGGPGTTFETKYVDLLHRTADGSWEVVYRMWSDD